MSNKLDCEEKFRLSSIEKQKLQYICERKCCTKSKLFRDFINNEYKTIKNIENKLI